ncbi:MAG TPA: DUF58 domain-containing protein [Steroidobacteraceae bacterium]|nr:DUF58 domain-containing protein [Steroidobacteraceae bacterium]
MATASIARRGWKSKLRERVAAWARRRQGDDSLPVTLLPRRIYILPTRAGLAFAALLLVMLIAGLNYSNSIALLFTFLLGGFALIAMHLCHRNLAGTVIRGVGAVHGFAGERGRLLLTLDNPADTPRIGLEVEAGEDGRARVSLRARATARSDLAIALPRRGRVPVERIRLSTSFPFGLFRAWTWLHPGVSLLAWPAPRGRREPPPETASGGSASAVHRAGDEEWAGLREFRDGDSPRQVAWPVYARGRGLMVKTYQSPAAHFRLFDLASAPGADLEQRLEQLAAWIVGAHARGERYGVRLGEQQVAPGDGSEHRERCLDGLALYGSGEPW